MINIITFLATSLSQNDKGHPVESSTPSSRKEKKKNTWKIQDPGSSSLSPFSPVIVFTSLVEVLHISPMEKSIGGDGDNLTTPP